MAEAVSERQVGSGRKPGPTVAHVRDPPRTPRLVHDRRQQRKQPRPDIVQPLIPHQPEVI
jgi:hypothetical protein